MLENYHEEIESYYDESLRDYEIVWQLKHSMALHYGFGTMIHTPIVKRFGT